MRYGWYYALGVIASSLRGIRADSLDSLEISTFEQQASTPALPTTVETVAPTATATAPAELPSVSSEPPREDATVTQQAQSSETPSSEAAQGAVTPSADLPGTATPTPDPSEQAETPTSAVPTSSTATSAETREATPVSSVTETVATPQPSSPPPLVEEVPLVEIPPAPELPSFQEWRDRYVVQLDPAGARRSRKAAQRVRQDAVGAAALGAGGAVYDGDGADLGSLFVIGDEGSVVRPAEPNRGAETRAAPLEPGGTDGSAYRHSQHASLRGHEVQPATSDMASPLQPVPNVGVGDESDPLVHLKDRSNYAAFECAAMVHRSSRQSKGASSILVEKKDRYMLTPCSANPKFVDVELCDEIQIDTIVLANFEYFSSTFKHFKASCSVDYPGKSQDWHDLGTYRANNARGVQVFRPLRNPHFCRYLRLDFLSHYGSEYYCPVSLLRVYGFTQLDAYRESERKAKALEEALAAADLIDEQELLELDLEDPSFVPSQPLPITVEYHTVEGGGTSAHASLSTSAEAAQASSASEAASPIFNSSPSSATTPSPASVSSSDALEASSRTETAAEIASPTASRLVITETSTTDASASISIGTTSTMSSSSSPLSTTTPSAEPKAQLSESESRPVPSSPASEAPSSSSTTSSGGDDSTAVPSAVEPTLKSVNSSMPVSPSATPSSVVRIVPTPEAVVPVIVQQVPLPPPPPPPPRPPAVQQPQPGESIYGTIMKRLTSLEHNQTISMHFIEAQSMMLKEAFGRVERRLHDIELSRGKQEQSVRQALLDLESQRVEMERERLALTTQVSLLSQEVRFGKRLTIAQLIGIFALIVFVGFTRALPTSPFLHLAASAQAERGLRWRRDRSARGSSIDDSPSPTVATSPLPTADASRKGHRASPSTSLSRGGDGGIKRKLSLSKPMPRRHYAVASAYSSGGRNGLLRALDLSKSSSRPRTPPMRHSSAPPEEPPESHASALEAREALRRRVGMGRSAGQTYRFPPEPSASSHLAQVSMAPASPGLMVPFPTPMQGSSTSPPFPSPGQEADSEREILLTVAEVASPALSSSMNGFGEDDAGYRTYSSGEETSPAHSRGPASLGSSPVAPRPPRHEMQIRPATSMGFIRDRSRADSILEKGQVPTADSHSLAIGPLPHETTPEPPPERLSESKPM